MSGTIEYIDLLSLLKAFGNKGLEKVEVYGKITRELDYPSCLKEGIVLSPSGIFVEMKVFAVNLKGYEHYLRQNGFNNKSGIYMVNGSIVSFVEKREIAGVDWYTISGTLRVSTKPNSMNIVNVFSFYKTNEGKWGLNPCHITDLDIGYWDKHSLCYAWIKESDRVGNIKHPDTVLRLPRFEAYRVSEPTSIKSNGVASESPVVPNNSGQYLNEVTFNKECRETIKDYNNTKVKFEDVLQKSKTSKEEFIKSLCSLYTESESSKTALVYLVNALKENLKRKPSPQAMTGKMILLKYLDNFEDSNDNYLGDMTCGQFLASNFDEVADYILDYRSVVNVEGKAWDLCKHAFGDAERFYAGIVGVVLGINFEVMQDIYEVCCANKLSIIKILNENPYILQFLSPLSFSEIERIALCFSRHNDRSLDTYRNVSMLNSYISDTSNGSTVFTKNQLCKAPIGIRLTKFKFEQMRREGTYLSSSLVINVQTYLNNAPRESFGYSISGFELKGMYYSRKISAKEIIDAINDYEASGLGVVLDGYVSSSSLLNKELFVFNTMFSLGSRTFNYDESTIDSYIAEYEAKVGFQLEERQRMAVHLLINAGFVVAGGAGSGKTTVSNCIVYVLSKLEPTLDVKFAAPTGKAAKRMQEVVHKEVKTLHSEFKLGTAQDTVLSEEDCDDCSGRTAYFFDEGAMVTIDLLYKVLKKVDVNSCRVFLFGDFDQLPPIGKGLPFKNLLRFMPCVFLNVTKRAAEGSNITANGHIINEQSSADNWSPLKSSDDFLLLPCKGDQIQKVVMDLCAYYLGRISEDKVSYIKNYLGLSLLPNVVNLTADDIQVVSPLAKENYKWGTISLNKCLKPLFNPKTNPNNTFVYKLTQSVEGNMFSIGDRVIHIDKNMYGMQWYSTYKDGRFQKIYGQGICNGEVGKVVDFVLADDCEFYEEIETRPDEFEYTGNMRIDKTWKGANKWFIVVEYYDYISDRNFYILYRAEENTRVTSNNGIAFKGDDVAKLNLFYAGTTHKLQGSQAKLIIFALDNVNYKGFITRQMIYTTVTRGSDLVIGVGSVSNDPSSMLSKARQDVASADTLTLGELFI